MKESVYEKSQVRIENVHLNLITYRLSFKPQQEKEKHGFSYLLDLAVGLGIKRWKTLS